MLSFTHKETKHEFSPLTIFNTYKDNNDSNTLFNLEVSYYCDKEIEDKNDKEIFFASSWFLIQKGKVYVNCQEDEEGNYEYMIFKTKFNNKKYFLTILDIEYGYYGDGQFLILNSEDLFFSVSVINSHPQLETTEFNYFNSDGSGANILGGLDFNNPDGSSCYKNFVKYYDSFVNDYYH